MNKFVKLYDSKTTPITGDVFTIVIRNYSEDSDIKDITGSYITKKSIGEANRQKFIDGGYTYGDPDSAITDFQKGTSRYPMVHPQQYYLVNDTSGSVDSDFVNELEYGDIIHLVDGLNSDRFYRLKVASTGCVDCGANTVKLDGLDYKDQTGSWRSIIQEKDLVRTYTDDDGSTVTPNAHATSASIEQKEDTSIFIDPDTIVAYQENPNNVSEMIVTFKENVFSKGSYTVIKDITHTGALNDIVIDSTSYIGDQVDIKIEIDSTTSPETFKWRFGDYISSTAPSNAYAETQRGLSLQFTPLDLGDGEIKVKWLATTGHTTDTWAFTVYPNNKRIYRNQIEVLDKLYK
tara:strand:- start:557 stop:1597 length:1041 start_codon:yes stop_codon:yes gene_type:complete